MFWHLKQSKISPHTLSFGSLLVKVFLNLIVYILYLTSTFDHLILLVLSQLVNHSPILLMRHIKICIVLILYGNQISIAIGLVLWFEVGEGSMGFGLWRRTVDLFNAEEAQSISLFGKLVWVEKVAWFEPSLLLWFNWIKVHWIS